MVPHARALAGKVALITGGSGGMGLACAHRLAAEGAAVALLARRADALAEAAEGLRRAGATEVLAVPADVSRSDDVRAAVAAVLRRFGRVDHLLNFAGYSADFPRISELRPGDEAIDDLERVVQVDLLGTARATFLVEPLMRAQGSGVIVAVGSTPTLETQPHDLLYQIAKAGARRLVEGVACQHRRDGVTGVRAYFLAPHYVYNPSTYVGMSPAQRRAADADGWFDSTRHVAPVVSFLLTGRVARESGASVWLDARTAAALFAEAGEDYPSFAPDDGRAR